MNLYNMTIQDIYNKYSKNIIEFIKFSLVGVFVTIISLILIYVFLEFLNTPLILTYILLYGSTIFYLIILIQNSHLRLSKIEKVYLNITEFIYLL